MPVQRQKIVAVGAAGGLLDQLDDLFRESAVEVQRFDNPEHALELMQAFEVDLVLVEHPLREHSIRQFVVDASDRVGGAGSKILILARDEAVSEMIEAVGDRYPVLVGEEPKTLRKRVAPHLRRFPERAKRLMVTMHVRMGAGGILRMAQTENVSETGALIRTQDRFPLGSEIELELALPGGAEPLAVVGEVVRYQEPDGEGPGGVGVTFNRLPEEAAERLNVYLDSLLAVPSS